MGTSPDSELIDEVATTPANTADRDALDDLVGPLQDQPDKPVVVGDSAYADGATRAKMAEGGFELRSKCPPVRNSTGGYTKEYFGIDLEADRVTCPAGHSALIRFSARGEGKASFKPHCAHCPLKDHCTPSRRGRTISIHPQEPLLQQARAEQKTPEWQAAYRADRPVVERKISHLVRRAWGGRRARTRGRRRVNTDLHIRAAALNWARLAVLGLHHDQAWALN
jgi:Transposase DDE domain/Iron-sulfur binding domain of endonuclease III